LIDLRTIGSVGQRSLELFFFQQLSEVITVRLCKERWFG
jgi:hypothetical protein